ncbi:MAG: hypothetical protein H6Q04_3098, partial [Acidobacteria bacterium]|nr:hypothetical protein [Acidobacteriota bacterium]
RWIQEDAKPEGKKENLLASLLIVSRRMIDEIVTEKRIVSVDMAHRLACLFNTTAEFRLGLQQDVDPRKAARKRSADHKKIKPLEGAAQNCGDSHLFRKAVLTIHRCLFRIL